MIRDQSTMIQTNFTLAATTEVLFASILGKKISLKEIKSYLHRLRELKTQTLKLTDSERLPSAFDFCETPEDVDMEYD